jgi:hypothetical protein
MQDPPGGGTAPQHVEAASMRWLSSAQPTRANLIITSSQPSAVATVKERYHWYALYLLYWYKSTNTDAAAAGPSLSCSR